MPKKNGKLYYIYKKRNDIIIYTIMYALVFLLLYIVYFFTMEAMECNANGGIYVSQVAAFPICFNP